MAELDAARHETVVLLSEKGDRSLELGQWEQSANYFRQALQILPRPVEDWESATWLFAALGDALYQGRDFQKALDSLLPALNCPNGLGNPFIHLRIGQCRFELGEESRALDDLTRAYMAGGSDVFEGEEASFDFLKTHVRL